MPNIDSGLPVLPPLDTSAKSVCIHQLISFPSCL